MQLSSLSLALTAAYGPGFAWRNLFTNNTPGFRINVEEAIRLNKAALGSKTSGFTADELSRCVAFQDSAGTLPVVSMEQPLGLILDTKLGVLVLGSQLVTNGGFDTDTAWTKGTGWAIGSGVATKTAGTASTLTPSTAIVPTVGRWYVVEYTITCTAGSLAVSIGAGTGAAKTASGTYREILCASTTGNLTFSADATFAGTVDSVSVRELPGNHFVQPSNTASRPIVSRRVNLLVGTATLATQNVTTLAASHVLTLSGTGSVTLSGTATGTYSSGTHTITTTAGTLTVTVSGSVTNADLRLAIDANLPPYQRVTSSTDYDEVGFPAYARADGLDDWLESGVVDMSSTDAVTVIAGVTKLSDAAAGIVIESSVDATSNAGAIALYAPDAAAATYEYTSRGTASADATASGQAAPRKSLLAGVSKISTDTAVLRINGAQAATSAIDQGTGNYTAQKFYMGRRGGANLPFNGRIYGVTVIGKLLTDSQLAAAEQAERQMGRLY